MVLMQMIIEECPTVRPTLEEFKDFPTFVEKLEKKYSNTHGIVKVVPPQGWRPKKGNYQALNNMMINGPIQQNTYGKGGVYECLHIQKKSMTVREYRKKIECFENITKGLSNEEVETLFWKNLSFSPPLYGADLKLSFMDETAGTWNLNNLNSVLTSSLNHPLPGVNTPYCYIGSWKSLFCWHTEDIELSAVNYLHIGKPKYWYGIRTSDKRVLQNEAKSYFGDNFQRCSDYLRHKTCLINPYLLKGKYPQLKIHKTVQYPGEFIMAFGGAYHCGFNSGFNMAEAVNYATYSWLDALKEAKSCKCTKDSVQMNQLQIADTLMKSHLKSNSKVLSFYNSLHPQIKKVSKLKDVRSTQGRKGDKDYHQDSAKEIQKVLRKKLIKKSAKSTVMIKGDQYKVQQWAQCDGCRKWRRVGHKRVNKRLSFKCRMIGSNCKAKEESNPRDINLSR